MALPFISLIFGFVLISINDSIFAAGTQSCYYPNGDLATDDSPCSSSVGICCPLNWDCMSNGLCYLENEDYYERHTCTDSSWPSNYCPRICTHDMQAPGNEALLWCDHKDWCCDGNRSWNCCTTSGTEYFDLPDPHSVAFITVTPNVPISLPTRSQSSSSQIPTNTPSSLVPAHTPVTTTSEPTHTSVTNGNDGVHSTQSRTSTTPANSTSPMANMSNHGSGFGLTMGLSISIPILVGICALIAFYTWRHRRRSKSSPGKPGAKVETIQANYQNIMPGSHAPELEGHPVSTKRTPSGRRSELYGSEAGMKSPTSSTGTNVTSPPQYSPVDGRTMGHIPEEPQELWGGYVPYRVPPTEQIDGHNEQERAENPEGDR